MGVKQAKEEALEVVPQVVEAITEAKQAEKLVEEN